MSAFLVEEKTLHKILSGLEYELRQSRWLKEQCEKELQIDFQDSQWQTHIGRRCGISTSCLWGIGTAISRSS